MNQHLVVSHGVTKEYPDGSYAISTAMSKCMIIAAFGHTIFPGLQFNSHIFKQMLVWWIYFTNTLFYAVEDSIFRTFLAYLLSCVCTPFLQNILLHSLIIDCICLLIYESEKARQVNGLRNIFQKLSTIITNWIIKLPRDCQKIIKNYFKALPLWINVIFDLWSWPNHRSYLGIIGH